MKRLLTTLLTVCVFVIFPMRVFAGGESGQRAEERTARHRLDGKENTVFLTIATGMTNHNQMVAKLKAEYSRQIKGNLYWGCVFSVNRHLGRMRNFDWDGRGPSPYRNTADQDIYKLDGMVFYRLPVIRSRLFFRLGGGFGAGYHRVRSVGSDHARRDRVLPYFNVEAAWILRVSRGFEMKFSPLVALAPSEFALSPVKLGAPADAVPWISDVGFSLTLGWRF